MENPVAIANYFVKKSLDSGAELTPLKVIKLVYLAHGWHLGIKNEPLITEAVEAWKYGPVINSVYHAFKEYRNSQITALKSIPVFSSEKMTCITPLSSDQQVIDLLDRVWQVYVNFSGVQLSTLTHETNSPWDIVWNQQLGKERKSAIIPNAVINSYYSTKVANS